MKKTLKQRLCEIISSQECSILFNIWRRKITPIKSLNLSKRFNTFKIISQKNYSQTDCDVEKILELPVDDYFIIAYKHNEEIYSAYNRIYYLSKEILKKLKQEAI